MRHLLFVAAAVVSLLPASFVAAQYYGGDPNSLVAIWYRNYLGRDPDPSSASWVNLLQQGTPPDVVLASILGSDEYYARAGSMPQGFVAQLYSNILQRAPSPGEVNYWVQRMYTENRTDIAHEILTQNPGIWIGSATRVQPAVPSVQVVPGVVVKPGYHWDRDRRQDWERHHDLYDYRRPYYPFRHGEHDEHEHQKRHP